MLFKLTLLFETMCAGDMVHLRRFSLHRRDVPWHEPGQGQIL